MKFRLSKTVHSNNIEPRDAVPVLHSPKCDYAAGQIGTLTSHINTVHNRLRKYRYTHSNYASSESGTLKRHINGIHKRLQPYKCSKCNYATTQSSNLKLHENTVHKHLQ